MSRIKKKLSKNMKKKLYRKTTDISLHTLNETRGQGLSRTELLGGLFALKLALYGFEDTFGFQRFESCLGIGKPLGQC